jgi:hypothetical protein
MPVLTVLQAFRPASWPVTADTNTLSYPARFKPPGVIAHAGSESLTANVHVLKIYSQYRIIYQYACLEGSDTEQQN